MSETHLHGWYSETAYKDFKKKYVYLNSYNKNVECTLITLTTSTKKPHNPYLCYKYNDDIKYMGTLILFIECIDMKS